MAEPLDCLDLANRVTLREVPLIFLDTCAILDILRAPYSDQAEIVDSALSIVEGLSEPRQIWVITTGNVIQEFNENRPSVQAELATKIQCSQRLLSCARKIFPDRRFDPFDLAAMNLAGRMSGVLDRFVGTLVTFRGTPDCENKAGIRVKAWTPPASKSRKQYMDCEIFEEFLELVSAIRERGVRTPAVFVTSNSKDYGSLPNGFDEIASNLAAVEARYAGNLSMALKLIRS